MRAFLTLLCSFLAICALFLTPLSKTKFGDFLRDKEFANFKFDELILQNRAQNQPIQKDENDEILDALIDQNISKDVENLVQIEDSSSFNDKNKNQIITSNMQNQDLNYEQNLTKKDGCVVPNLIKILPIDYSVLQKSNQANLSKNVNKISIKDDENLTIVLIGDSIMQGIYYWGFLSEFKDKKTKIDNLSQKSSGLFSANWAKILDDELTQIETQKLIVAHFGPNDWGNLNEKNRMNLQKYESKIDEIYDVAKKHNANVIWLGIPCMKNSLNQERAYFLNDIFSQKSIQHEQNFISANAEICDKDGAFIKHKTIGKKQIIIRADDGLHLSYLGAKIVVKKIISEYDK